MTSPLCPRGRRTTMTGPLAVLGVRTITLAVGELHPASALLILRRRLGLLFSSFATFAAQEGRPEAILLAETAARGFSSRVRLAFGSGLLVAAPPATVSARVGIPAREAVKSGTASLRNHVGGARSSGRLAIAARCSQQPHRQSCHEIQAKHVCAPFAKFAPAWRAPRIDGAASVPATRKRSPFRGHLKSMEMKAQ